MDLRQKVVSVLAAIVLVVSDVVSAEGDFGSAALGVFLAASAVINNFRVV